MEILEKVMDVIWHFTGGTAPRHLEGESCMVAVLTCCWRETVNLFWNEIVEESRYCPELLLA